MSVIRIDPSRVVGRVDRKIFSGFVEHLGRCIYGGLYEPGHNELAEALVEALNQERSERGLTWAQLGLHRYPCAFLDVRGYYRDLRSMVDHMAAERFVRAEQRDSVWFGEDIAALFDWMHDYEGGYQPKWLDRDSVHA